MMLWVGDGDCGTGDKASLRELPGLRRTSSKQPTPALEVP